MNPSSSKTEMRLCLVTLQSLQVWALQRRLVGKPELQSSGVSIYESRTWVNTGRWKVISSIASREIVNKLPISILSKTLSLLAPTTSSSFLLGIGIAPIAFSNCEASTLGIGLHALSAIRGRLSRCSLVVVGNRERAVVLARIFTFAQHRMLSNLPTSQTFVSQYEVLSPVTSTSPSFAEQLKNSPHAEDSDTNTTTTILHA